MKTQKISVVHLTSVHPRNDSRVFLKECRSLAKFGYRVTLVVADGRGNEIKDRVLTLDVGYRPGRLARMLSTTRRVYKKALELDADIYQLHDPELLPFALKLKRRGKIVIFDAHEDLPKQILGKHYLWRGIRKIIAWAFEKYERYVCKQLDGVVAATPTLCKKYHNIHPNTTAINNYPLIGELDPVLQDKKSGREVCYVGSIAAIRGVCQMVKALELTETDIKLHLVGTFAEPNLERMVSRYASWNRVQHWGFQTRDGVRDVMARSVAGVVVLHPTPNYVESLPVKMFEYMSAGIPVIASNFPLWREIIEGNQCGICIDPLDTKAIAEAINEIVNNTSKARRMGENGKQAVIKRYNWTKEETKLLKYYSNLSTMI